MSFITDELKQAINEGNEDEAKRLLNKAGYIHIPTAAGRSTVVHSFDNENERVMTFDEWAEEAESKGWTRGQA